MSGWFVPLVIAVAAIAFIAWAMFGPRPRLAHRLGGAHVGPGGSGARPGELVRGAAAPERWKPPTR